MKCLPFLLLLLPFGSFAQKVKVNEYDKFIKQRRIELEPLPIMNTEKVQVTLTYNSIGQDFYVLLSGYGWGAFSIDSDNEMIFLLANDSTVTVKSTGIQMTDISGPNLSYKHRYSIKPSDLDILSKNEIVGIRKYGVNDFTDLKVSKAPAQKLQVMSGLFVDELKKSKILYTLKKIRLEEIAAYVGDSVQFNSKVFSTRYFETAPNKPTLLDINSSPDLFVSTIIMDGDRKNFGAPPELLYNNREVTISGVVRLQNNQPQIIIRNRDQISLRSAISPEDVALFTGDSVTVRGRVFSAKHFPNSSNGGFTLLNMGAAYPNQLLTVMVEDAAQKVSDNPETYFSEKDIQVTGRITLYKGKPQIVTRAKNQIALLSREGTRTAQSTPNNNTNNTNSSNNPGVQQTVLRVPASELRAPDRTASFPGGEQAWVTFLKNNLNIPAELVPGEKRVVIVRFHISSEGDVSKYEITKSGGKSFDREVLRLMKRMPKWTPQTKNGTAVPVTFTQPVIFDDPVGEAPANASVVPKIGSSRN